MAPTDTTSSPVCKSRRRSDAAPASMPLASRSSMLEVVFDVEPDRPRLGEFNYRLHRTIAAVGGDDASLSPRLRPYRLRRQLSFQMKPPCMSRRPYPGSWKRGPSTAGLLVGNARPPGTDVAVIASDIGRQAGAQVEALLHVQIACDLRGVRQLLARHALQWGQRRGWRRRFWVNIASVYVKFGLTEKPLQGVHVPASSMPRLSAALPLVK